MLLNTGNRAQSRLTVRNFYATSSMGMAFRIKLSHRVLKEQMAQAMPDVLNYVLKNKPHLVDEYMNM